MYGRSRSDRADPAGPRNAEQETRRRAAGVCSGALGRLKDSEEWASAGIPGGDTWDSCDAAERSVA